MHPSVFVAFVDSAAFEEQLFSPKTAESVSMRLWLVFDAAVCCRRPKSTTPHLAV